MTPDRRSLGVGLLCLFVAIIPLSAYADGVGAACTPCPQFPVCQPPLYNQEFGCVPTPLFPPPPPLISPIISAPVISYCPPSAPGAKVKRRSAPVAQRGETEIIQATDHKGANAAVSTPQQKRRLQSIDPPPSPRQRSW